MLREALYFYFWESPKNGLTGAWRCRGSGLGEAAEEEQTVTSGQVPVNHDQQPDGTSKEFQRKMGAKGWDEQGRDGGDSLTLFVSCVDSWQGGGINRSKRTRCSVGGEANR